MPSFASGNRSWTAWASTCAVECRRMSRPSALSIATGCDLVAVAQLVRQVAQGAADPGCDHVGSVGEQLPGLGARRHRPVLPRGGVDEDDVDVGHELGSCGLLTAVPDQTPADRPMVSAGRGRRRPGFRRRAANRGGSGPGPDAHGAGRSRECADARGAGRKSECERARRARQSQEERLAGDRRGLKGGRYWVRTSDLFGVNEARYHCANRPGWGSVAAASRRRMRRKP